MDMRTLAAYVFKTLIFDFPNITKKPTLRKELVLS